MLLIVYIDKINNILKKGIFSNVNVKKTEWPKEQSVLSHEQAEDWIVIV